MTKSYVDNFGSTWFNLVSVTSELTDSDNENIVKLQKDLERLANEFENARLALVDELTKEIESNV